MLLQFPAAALLFVVVFCYRSLELDSICMTNLAVTRLDAVALYAVPDRLDGCPKLNILSLGHNNMKDLMPGLQEAASFATALCGGI